MTVLRRLLAWVKEQWPQSGHVTSLPHPQSDKGKDRLGSGQWTSPSRRKEEADSVRLSLAEEGRYQTMMKGSGSGRCGKVQQVYCLLVVLLLAATILLQYVLVKYVVAPLLDTRHEQGQITQSEPNSLQGQ